MGIMLQQLDSYWYSYAVPLQCNTEKKKQKKKQKTNK